MDVIETLSKAIELLDAIDQEYEVNPTYQSLCDSKLSDIYHYIENNRLNTNQRYRVVGLLNELRNERRGILNTSELLRVYKLNENKLSQKDNRKMLLAELKKREKTLNMQYKNRVYTEEELKELIGE